MSTATPDPGALPARMPALDGLRAIAVLLVVPHNFNLMVALGGAAYFVVVGLHRGWIGVQLFFVRRVLRIFPLYYFTLLVLLVVLPGLGLVPAPRRDALLELSYWAYFSNWYGPFHPGEDSLSHFWSLACEEQFYLLWPFVVYRRSARWVLRLCLAVAAAALLVRIGMLRAGAPVQAIYQFLATRMDALAFGGAAAAAFRIPSAASWALNRRRLLSGTGLASIAAGAAISRGYNFAEPATLSLGYTLLGLGFALLVAAAAATDWLGAGGWLAALRWDPLRRIAKYSYAMYVLSVPIHFLAGKPALSALGLAPGDSLIVGLGYVFAGTAVSFLAAAASYYFFERHFLELKDRLAAPGAAP